ncbi:TraG-like protein [Sulfuritortus calidifontis]|uniref:TraG-like protein n=1 Tax=Sulfuritortus calidifontis TaxID=1914471 RepID=A0A4R3JXR5_9PROT|nr:conjugal transfer protein TraG N-terminal domain-containing protein [Sulfuritortus calidifontis]TCS71540.1 TraG-like protein [Sulfuritortus calidifontis]
MQCVTSATAARDYAASSATQQASNFSQIVTTFGNICLAIFFAFAPIAIAYAAFAGPSGIGILMKFVMFGAWTQTFLPMAAILNYAMYSNLDSFSHQVFIANQGVLGTGTIDALYDHAVRVHTVLAEMVGYIPLVSLAIITGSMHAWTHVARGVGQTMDTVTKDNAARDVGGMEGTAALAGMLPGTSSLRTYHAASSMTAKGLAGGGVASASNEGSELESSYSYSSSLNNRIAQEQATQEKYSHEAQQRMDAAVRKATGIDNTTAAYREYGRRMQNDHSKEAQVVRGLTNSLVDKGVLSAEESEEYQARVMAGLQGGLSINDAVRQARKFMGKGGVGREVVKGLIKGMRAGVAAGVRVPLPPQGKLVGAVGVGIAMGLIEATSAYNAAVASKDASKIAKAGKNLLSAAANADAQLASIERATMKESESFEKAVSETLGMTSGQTWRDTESQFRGDGSRTETSIRNAFARELGNGYSQVWKRAEESAEKLAWLRSVDQERAAKLNYKSGDLAYKLRGNFAATQAIQSWLSNPENAAAARSQLANMPRFQGTNMGLFAGAVQHMINTHNPMLDQLVEKVDAVNLGLKAPDATAAGIENKVGGDMLSGRLLDMDAAQHTDGARNFQPSKAAVTPHPAPPPASGQTPEQKAQAAYKQESDKPSGVRPGSHKPFSEGDRRAMQKIHQGNKEGVGVFDAGKKLF